MSDLTAPVGGAEAIPPAVTPATEPTTPREAAQALARARWAKREKEQAPAAPEPAAAETPDLPEVAEAAPVEEQPSGEVETQAPEPAELPPIEAPRSWTKDEQERFKSYPRELQAYLSEREQERDRDLRRRQNEAADARKAIEAEQQQVAKARQEYEAALPQLMQLMQQESAGEFADIKTWADAERVAAEDPVRFNRWQARQQKIAAMGQEAQAAEQRRAQELQANWTKFAQDQDKALAEKAPEVFDKDRGPKLKELAASALRDVGFSEQELTESWNGQRGISLRDHRLQLLLLDGVKFREAKAAKPVAKPVPPVQRPGAAQPKGAAHEAQIQALDKQLETASGMNAIRIAAEKRKLVRADAQRN